MDKVFKVAELISEDIRSRSNAEAVRVAIGGMKGEITLDFTGVVFMSRSFADELYNIVDGNGNVSLRNMDGIVKSMYEAVKDGRKSVRIFKKETSEIQVLKDMESLSAFCSTF